MEKRTVRGTVMSIEEFESNSDLGWLKCNVTLNDGETYMVTYPPKEVNDNPFIVGTDVQLSEGNFPNWWYPQYVEIINGKVDYFTSVRWGERYLTLEVFLNDGELYEVKVSANERWVNRGDTVVLGRSDREKKSWNLINAINL